ncbi:MAG: sigma 54-interacting transcriptional regulator [Candidatus Thiodiazotropha endolucinida]|nr:sigma 54-interacting transcriptional regulator [Candidatus Thiodiazotropha endolucinida]
MNKMEVIIIHSKHDVTAEESIKLLQPGLQELIEEECNHISDRKMVLSVVMANELDQKDENSKTFDVVVIEDDHENIESAVFSISRSTTVERIGICCSTVIFREALRKGLMSKVLIVDFELKDSAYTDTGNFDNTLNLIKDVGLNTKTQGTVMVGLSNYARRDPPAPPKAELAKRLFSTYPKNESFYRVLDIIVEDCINKFIVTRAFTEVLTKDGKGCRPIKKVEYDDEEWYFDRSMIEDPRFISTYYLDDTDVLLLGEPGVGKDIVARLIHQNSSDNRRNGRFLAVNCAQFDGEIFEANIFGIEKNVATGVNTREGYLQQTRGGVLFLDEVGEIPINQQAKLLRVLQDKKVTKVGGVETFDVDVKIIAATNRNLEDLVNHGHFRRDLLSRLKKAVYVIPPLRERREMILPLTRLFLRKFEKRLRKYGKLSGVGDIFTLDAAAETMIVTYSWDEGNIRQLNSVIENAAQYCHIQGRTIIELEDLSLESDGSDSNNIRKQQTIKSQEQSIDIEDELLSLIKRNNSKLWCIENLSDVRERMKGWLTKSTIQKNGKKITILPEESWQYQLIVRYVCLTNKQIQTMEIELKPRYHPEPNYVKQLFNTNEATKLLKSIVLHHAKKEKTSPRDAFFMLGEFVFNEEIQMALPEQGCKSFKVGSQNVWEANTMGAGVAPLKGLGK